MGWGSDIRRLVEHEKDRLRRRIVGGGAFVDLGDDLLEERLQEGPDAVLLVGGSAQVEGVGPPVQRRSGVIWQVAADWRTAGSWKTCRAISAVV